MSSEYFWFLILLVNYNWQARGKYVRKEKAKSLGTLSSTTVTKTYRDSDPLQCYQCTPTDERSCLDGKHAKQTSCLKQIEACAHVVFCVRINKVWGCRVHKGCDTPSEVPSCEEAKQAVLKQHGKNYLGQYDFKCERELCNKSLCNDREWSEKEAESQLKAASPCCVTNCFIVGLCFSLKILLNEIAL